VFAQLLRDDVADRSFPTTKRSRGWSIVQASARIASMEEFQDFSITLEPPAVTTLPSFLLTFCGVDQIETILEEFRVVRSRVAGVIVIIDNSNLACRWHDNALAIVSALEGLRSTKDGRIATSVAIVGLVDQGDTQTELLDIRTSLLERAFIDQVAGTRRFGVVPLDSAETTPRGEARGTAAEVVHWCVTALDPTLLSPGLTATMNRTPAPALAWYALTLWTCVVVAPGAFQRVLGWMLEQTALSFLASDATRGAVEVADLDPVLVSCAIFLTIALRLVMMVAAPDTAESSSTPAPAERFRKWSVAAIAAAWLLVLVPRAITAPIVASVASLDDRMARSYLETALNSQNFRASAIVCALMATLAVLVARELYAWRRDTTVFAARRREREMLTSRART